MGKIKGVGVFLLVIVLLVVLSLAGLAWRYHTAEIRGRVGAEEQIESSASRIQRYQEFFSICQSVQTKEDAIDNLRANTSMDESRKDSAITANQNARAQLINEYNSKSAQSYTAARFKASNLIYQIPRGAYESNRTNCIVNQ
jgi:hypothetical protein